MLVISTPERKTYSDKRHFENEFHEHEFYQDEFRRFLGEVFPRVEILGQRLVGLSAVWPLDERSSTFDTTHLAADPTQTEPVSTTLDPMYCIASAPQTHGARPIPARSRSPSSSIPNGNTSESTNAPRTSSAHSSAEFSNSRLTTDFRDP